MKPRDPAWRGRWRALAPLFLAIGAHAHAAPATLEERPSSRILYHEEGGGLIVPTAPPRPGNVRSKMPQGPVAPPQAPQAPPAKAVRSPAPGTPMARTRRPAAPALVAQPVVPPVPESMPAVAPVSPQQAQADADRAAYAAALARHAASNAPPVVRARALADEGGSAIVAYRDAAVATMLGWQWLEGGDAASAGLWFGRARTWAPDSEEAMRGAAYAALREKRFDDALAAAQSLPEGIEAKPLLVREAQSGLAWADLRLGRREAAEARFAQLYRTGRDRESAQGLLAANALRTRLDADLAQTEPLATFLLAERGESAFRARRFLEAGHADPARYGDLGAAGARQASLLGAWREKTGADTGEGLRTRTEPAVEVSARVSPQATLGARFERIALEAGPQRADVQEARLQLRWERELAVTASLGAATAAEGLSSHAIGGVEVALAPEWGQATLALSREPVRESIWSHAGRASPGQPAAGRVARTGVNARVLALHAAPWSIGASAKVAHLEGVNVQSNRHAGAEVAVGYDLALKGFAYAALSASAGLERYQRNLSRFTPGHGGYFSPQRFRRAGLAFDFMTAEGAPWMLRGRLSAGRFDKVEDDAPTFPLAPDGTFFRGNRDRGHDGSVQLAAAVRLSPHWQLGVGVARSLSPQFAEKVAYVQLRGHLEPRRGVLSTDLPLARVE